MDSTQNLTPPFDPTGYTSITGAQLLQFVSGVSPYTDKGFVIVTTDLGSAPVVPDGNGDTALQRYLWLRLSPGSSLSVLYTWNPYAPNGALQYWNPISFTSSIPANSILGTQIAPGSIDYTRIINIQQSQIQGYQSILGIGSVFGPTPATPTVSNNIAGTFTNGLYVMPASILNSMMFADATTVAGITAPNAPVSTQNIVGRSVTLDKLAPTGSVSGQVLTSQGPTSTPSWANSTQKIIQTVVVETTVPSFASVSSAALGEIVTNAAPNLTLSGGTIQNNTNTGIVCGYTQNTTAGVTYGACGPQLALSITPQLLTSFFKIEVEMVVACNVNTIATLALYGFNSSADATAYSINYYASASSGIPTFGGTGSIPPLTMYPGGKCVFATQIHDVRGGLITTGAGGTVVASYSSVATYASTPSLVTAGVPFQTIKCTFIVPPFTFLTIGQPLTFVPFIGANNGTCQLGFNGAVYNTSNLGFNQNTGGSGTTAPTAVYGGGVLASKMIIQEIIL